VDKRLAAAGGKYKIEWTKAYGGTLVKLGNESTAMKDGISDLGFVATIFEAAKFPLQNVTYYAPSAPRTSAWSATPSPTCRRRSRR